MIRIILTIVLPLLLPTLVFIAYTALENRRVAAAGGQPYPWYVRAPWLTLVGIGVLLAGAALLAFTRFDSAPPGGRYIPAHIGPDGTLVPGRTVPAAEEPSER